MVADWGAAVSQALTGGPAVNCEEPDVARIIKLLNEVGWTAEKLETARQTALSEVGGWPYPVSRELLGQLGPAQFQAVLTQIRSKLGLTGSYQTFSTRNRKPDLDDQRLLDELPPHFGRFG